MQNIFEMYVHTSPHLRDKSGNYVNTKGETLKKISIDELPEDKKKEILNSELSERKRKRISEGKEVSVRKHVYVNDKGEIFEPARNPNYDKRRVTVCALCSSKDENKNEEIKVGYAICRNDDIAISRYSKSLGRKIAKARALKSTSVIKLINAERKDILSSMFQMLDHLQDDNIYTWQGEGV